MSRLPEEDTTGTGTPATGITVEAKSWLSERFSEFMSIPSWVKVLVGILILMVLF